MENQLFFASGQFKNQATSYIQRIREFSASEKGINLNSFEKKMCDYISRVLDHIIKVPDQWNNRCEHNINVRFADLLLMLQDDINSPRYIEAMFAELYLFVIEYIMFDDFYPSGIQYEFFMFGLDFIDSFEGISRTQIRAALLSQPTVIVKKCLHNLNIKTLQDSQTFISMAEARLNIIQNEINAKLIEVKRLSDTLHRHETAFNFVGLYAGFAKLGRIKSAELKATRKMLFCLAGLLPVPLIAEALYLIFSSNTDSTITHLIKLIPVISLTLILIYYFRVILNSFNSIKSQLMQIELRKSLCRFIQSYSEYSKEMRVGDINPLAKFEEVIFSNIMGSDDKTPSTFDGIEQLASMIKALKGN